MTSRSDQPANQLIIRTLKPEDWNTWDYFVQHTPEATFFHRAGWQQVIEETFSHKTYFLMAESGGEIQGILPLAHIQSRLFGNALISTPFCVYGGIVAHSDLAKLALEKKAKDLAQKLAVDHLECRNLKPCHPTWQNKDLYYAFSKSIDPDPHVNLLAIPRKQRAEVRKGIKQGLVGEIDEDVWGRCYDIYSESVHNLGTPVFSRNYFRVLKKVFGNDCQGLVITRDGKAVSAVLSFYFKKQVLPYYGGGTSEARRFGGTHFLYWELMRHANERGVDTFDFGRSKRGSGSFDFKKYYGFEPKPLYYEYFLVGSETLPNVSPNNPKYKLFIKLWKRLPLPVSRWIGPWVARNLG